MLIVVVLVLFAVSAIYVGAPLLAGDPPAPAAAPPKGKNRRS